MMLLGVDIGTTHCKAGLFDLAGSTQYIASRDMPLHRSPAGYAYYDPQEVWEIVGMVIGEVTAWARVHGKDRLPIAAVGIASMAESGLLVDRGAGSARTSFIPWFDPITTPQAEKLRAQVDVQERFCKCGIRPTFKCAVSKLLWLRQQDPALLDGAVWLSAADYVAYRLTGCMATDLSLAGRTYAFRIDEKTWDTEWLASIGINDSLFPPVLPGGASLGRVAAGLPDALAGLSNVPVGIGGHDHICAAFASSVLAGGVQPDLVFDSIGTAESLVGALPEHRLGEKEWRTGFSYGLHVAPGFLYWTGGLSTSGGALEWLRAVLGAPPLSYAELDQLLAAAPVGPGEVMFFPYLAGRGSPHTDPLARGAFIGLGARHSRADLYRAVLEGAAYEVEFMRRAAEQASGETIRRLVATGGGTRNRPWMQIRADVTGCQVQVLSEPEAAALGAALLAGVGCGVYRSLDEVVACVTQPLRDSFEPQTASHEAYCRRYEQGFLEFQEPLSEYGRQSAQELG
jgi:sugar (pentulose or hexulose) kinase